MLKMSQWASFSIVFWLILKFDGAKTNPFFSSFLFYIIISWTSKHQNIIPTYTYMYPLYFWARFHQSLFFFFNNKVKFDPESTKSFFFNNKVKFEPEFTKCFLEITEKSLSQGGEKGGVYFYFKNHHAHTHTCKKKSFV